MKRGSAFGKKWRLDGIIQTLWMSERICFDMKIRVIRLKIRFFTLVFVRGKFERENYPCKFHHEFTKL